MLAPDSNRRCAVKRALVVLVGVGAVLAVPAAASAQVQIDRGIAGARLHNTSAQVHAALGRPARTHRGTNDFGRFTEETYAGGIMVTYQGGTTVSAVSTSGLGDRTASGVGVRSTEAQVRRGVPSLHCETVSGARSCHTGSFRPGQRITDFLLSGGRVTRVTVGFVID
jgi:hypothetical protein